mmetsp:Transcript_938/g.1086  ORF Transcript_938/g.1086 Transcript_938/m.1086 type:complete len:776 (+) Transcript_938:238-2565(+)|eukprot:CAMPEP_0203758210 /NCGR_PEP_ID=MMETSP0098-20131031/10968_1 /ASSEMBLY_ACC=CAM_ASM_000208 /TAXON_ID=96639 /ORGANISM=" , Strain NY0313808BC1" /LENGTH=775 /DNA_ID=CAMNT_0050650507 /DNA_START=121 /DNA_END=2448 /DNA_ORIENTATION=-
MMFNKYNKHKRSNRKLCFDTGEDATVMGLIRATWKSVGGASLWVRLMLMFAVGVVLYANVVWLGKEPSTVYVEEVGEVTIQPSVFQQKVVVPKKNRAKSVSSKLIVRNRCPRDTKVTLIFPHVNKAGGRSLEAIFANLAELGKQTRHRYISALPRSSTHTFELLNGHRTYSKLALDLKCFQSGKPSPCEITKGDTCRRWIYMLRDPVRRMVSAFYATTGRGKKKLGKRTAINGGTGAFGDSHFYCKPGSIAHTKMANSSYTIEMWAALPAKERAACKYVDNLHVKYLAPEEKDGSKRQLELAKARLEQMSWFGILEKWVDSLHLFGYTIGTDLVFYTPTFNVAFYNKSDLSNEVMDVLRSHNKLDIKLYEFAVELFQKRVDEMKKFPLDPFYHNETYVCGDRKICWDKRDLSPPWEFDLDQNVEHFSSPGEMKENQLCTAEAGCTRSDHYKKTVDVITNKANSGCWATFFILGARKGGSTSLYEYVSKHPHFLGMRQKSSQDPAKVGELFFFETVDPDNKMKAVEIRERFNNVVLNELSVEHSNTKLNHKGSMNQQYAELMSSQWFQNLSIRNALTGESSVGNGPSCHVPRQIAMTCGKNLKFVYLLRHPVDRIVSQYRMRKRFGHTNCTLEDYVKNDLEKIKSLIPAKDQWWEGDPPCLFKRDYLNAFWSSMYIVHLNRWFNHFSKKNILLIKSEDFFQNPRIHLENVYKFIGLDGSLVDTERIVSQQFNQAPRENNKTEKLSPETRKLLLDFFEPYNMALESKYGIDLGNWQA